MRDNPQWNPKVEAQLRNSLGAIYKGRFAAIWIPAIEQIGGVYRLKIDKKAKTLMAIPTKNGMPALDIDGVDAVEKVKPGSLKQRLGGGVKKGLFLINPLVLNLVPFREAMVPTVTYNMVVTPKFFVEADPKSKQILAYMMISRQTYKEYRWFWKRWERKTNKNK